MGGIPPGQRSVDGRLNMNKNDINYGNASFGFCPYCFLRNGHEQLCAAFPVWHSQDHFFPKDASVHVILGICAHGTASWNAYPGNVCET